MARKRRVFVPGASVHVFQRGNNRGPIFTDDHDRVLFLEFLGVAAPLCGVAVHGFSLMSNHYHLVVTPNEETSLSQTIHDFGGQYVQYYNRKHGRTGTLWDGRFKDKAITDERQFFTCLRYIEHNPVKARMVSSPDQYRWSSYRVHAHGEPSTWLVPHALYLALGATAEERQAAYRAVVRMLPEEEVDGV